MLFQNKVHGRPNFPVFYNVMERKIITVFGATGQQGGSVVEALLTNSEYSVRAVTR